MARAARGGLMGLAVGIAGGIIAAILLAPKRKDGQQATRASGSRVDAVLDLAQTSLETIQNWWRRLTAADEGAGLLPDERVTTRVRSQLSRNAIWSPRLDVTTIDGTVYLRGREPDAARAETIVTVAREVPGVIGVVDEIRRE